MTAVFDANRFFKADAAEFDRIIKNPSYRTAPDKSYAIHLTWLLKDFEHVACYPRRGNWDSIAQWCIEYAGANNFLLNRSAQAVLFKSSELATMCKLTWSE
jgi:hypothetical protein